jgi:peroxisomal 3,2-trans-enoyl-CoA isomerase
VLIFGKKLTAEEALDIGFISRVIPHAQFESETAKILAQYAELPADSLRFNKKTIRDFERNYLHQVNKLECKLLCERWQSKVCFLLLYEFHSNCSICFRTVPKQCKSS